MIQCCFDLVTTVQMPSPWWNAVSRLDWLVVEAHLLPFPANVEPAEERVVELEDEDAAVLDEEDERFERHEQE